MARLLIVDDDPDIRTMFARALSAIAEIEQAGGGAEAIRALSSREFDVLLLDLHMPAVDGFAVLEALTSKPGPNRDMPVFIITADMSDAARVRALRRHAVFLLTKPVNLGTLRSFVTSSLQKRTARTPVPPARTPVPPARIPVPPARPSSLARTLHGDEPRSDSDLSARHSSPGSGAEGAVGPSGKGKRD